MKLFVFFIFISVWGGQSFAAPMQIGRIRYQITDEKNLPQILRKFLKSGSRLKSDGPVFKINKERNSHIDDWNDLDEGAEIDLYLPKGMVSAKKFKAYLALKKRRLEESKRKAPSPWNTSVFSGIKYLIYINASINKKYYFHVLYKQHSMTGPGDLNVSRIGLGIGYNL